jgi:hypothetical protein
MVTVSQIIVGVILAIGYILLVRQIFDLDREKISYGIGLSVAALIYVVLGAFSGSTGWLLTELCGLLIYTVFVVLGIRRSGWFLVFGWALHPVWDLVVHDSSTEFVSRWYQIGCFGFDLAVAAYIGFRERQLK